MNRMITNLILWWFIGLEPKILFHKHLHKSTTSYLLFTKDVKKQVIQQETSELTKISFFYKSFLKTELPMSRLIINDEYKLWVTGGAGQPTLNILTISTELLPSLTSVSFTPFDFQRG